MKKKRKGFTLIEMVVVMLIISMLLLLIVPNLAAKKNDAQNTTDRAVIETIQSEVDMHQDDSEKPGKTTDEFANWSELSKKQQKQVTRLKLHLDKDNKVVSDKVKQDAENNGS